jgi:N-methylhydantoinase A
LPESTRVKIFFGLGITAVTGEEQDMPLKIGVDVGGTFTDFLVFDEKGKSAIFKVLSTPEDPSIGLMNGLQDIAAAHGLSLKDLARRVETIVHGTTVTTNVTLTRTGARTGLITTEGVRDALEMRRGIREEQYNNRYTNVPPLSPRYLRWGIRGRLDAQGAEIEPLDPDGVGETLDCFKREGVEAVAVCMMNSFANPAHEEAAARTVLENLPKAFLSVSSRLLPSIRFYDRVSTTVLNAYVGPTLKNYLDSLLGKLEEIGFQGVLLIMQSNGGVIKPELACERPAMTLLSGPAAGPGAGSIYTRVHGFSDYITVDMGGTSFDAALVRGGVPRMAQEGSINRYRLALPMLEIVTIGAGGGSIGWIDEGGLLRMGPQSAGADPGPACYQKGGDRPACTDADLILGYLDADYFAGGRIKLSLEHARRAIKKHVADPLKLSVEEAASGMYRVINTNMAHGVREVSIKQGFDPREFPLVVAGGAGPLHACMICHELEIPFFLVPRESSIFCAAGMLLSDLKHDYVRSLVSRMDRLEGGVLKKVVQEMVEEGEKTLTLEHIPKDKMRFEPFLDMRYVKQYHEVSCPAALEEIYEENFTSLVERFHKEHNRLYGYSLENEETPVELINVRLTATGETDKPAFEAEAAAGEDAAGAIKGDRRIFLPEQKSFEKVAVYDGHALKHGNRIQGPALIEQVNTTVFISAGFDALCDPMGSFVVFQKGFDFRTGRVKA